MSLRIITTVLLLSLSLVGFSQKEILLHLDKPYYVSGEIAWFKLYLPTEYEDQNCMLKVNLARSNGSIVDEFFLKTEGGSSVEGYYKFGYDIPSDQYQLLFSALNTASNEEQIVGKYEVPVYNDLTPPSANSSGAAGSSSTEEYTKTGDLNVIIEFSKDTYLPRDEIRMRIRTNNNENSPVPANISISVVDADLIGRNHKTQSVQVDESSTSDISNLSENIYRKGRITNEEGAGLRTNVIGAFSGLENAMFYTKSNDNGEYVLDLPDFDGSKPIQLTGNIFEEHADITLDFEDNIGSQSGSSLQFDETINNYLTTSRNRKKIYQFYKKTEAYIDQAQVQIDEKELKPNSTFRLKDYEAFENMAAFFNELLSSNLDFPTTDDGNFIARMYNPEARGQIRHFSGAPIFILDGKMTDDADFVGKMSTETVESADLYFITKDIRQQFGTFGSSPFVFIHTNQPDIAIPENDADDIFRMNGIQPQGQFMGITEEDRSGGVPIFRPMVHWDANQNTNQSGFVNIPFNHSDDVGTFLVTVVARDNEGNLSVGRGVYKVGNVN